MAQMNDKYDAKEEKKSLSQIQKFYRKTLLDGNFQRYGGVKHGSGWSIKNSSDYMDNLVSGCTFNHIIVAEVNGCLLWAERIGDQASIDYLSDVQSQGYEYISIDGNNTSSTVNAFFEGHEKITIKGKKLADFTEDEQEDIKYTEKIRFITLREIGIEDMCNLFRALNTSTKLNGQEWRQARWSPLSQSIRDISNGDNRIMFKNLIFNKESDLDKRFHEEMTAQLALKIEKDFRTAKDGGSKKRGSGSNMSDVYGVQLDQFYEENHNLEDDTRKRLSQIFKITSDMARAVGPQQHKFAKGSLHMLWNVIEIANYRLSLKIDDCEAFYEWFIKKNDHFAQLGGNVPDQDRDESSYSYWRRFYSATNSYNKMRTLFSSALIEDLEDLVNDGVLSHKRTKRDNFTWEQKLELFHKQNGKTRKNQKIKYLDIYLGKYEADHMVSVKDGGQTEISNGELMLKEDNRKKGSNSNEPFFPHQMSEQQEPEVASR